MKLEAKQFEIFCGTGGVGKTTLSASRGLFLSIKKNWKVLLITIDPSRRLKDFLSINDIPGQTHRVNIERFQQLNASNCTGLLDALLFCPTATLKRIMKSDKVKSNEIIDILSRPYGGLNEILALVELQYHLDNNKYDTVILDTPPGKHFIDFINGCRKINNFFDKNFIDIFQHFSQKINDFDKKFGFHAPVKIFNFIVSESIKKFIKYLSKLTGDIFIQEFINTLTIVYDLKDPFLKAAKFQDKYLKNVYISNWFLVTSTDHDKIADANSLKKEINDIVHRDKYLLINRCLNPYWDEWEKQKAKNLSFKKKSNLIDALKVSMYFREQKILENTKESFVNVLTFKEVIDSSLQKQLEALISEWNNF